MNEYTYNAKTDFNPVLKKTNLKDFKLRIRYEFQGYKKDYCVEFRNGECQYKSLEEYTSKFVTYFPNATFEIMPEEIVEFELIGE